MIKLIKVYKLYISKRHLLMNQPLHYGGLCSLYFYTSLSSYKSLNNSHRNNNWKKWNYFDYQLHNGIYFLSFFEKTNFPLYSGIQNVKLSSTKKIIGTFKDFVSSSVDINIAKSFMQQKGILLIFDKTFRGTEYRYACCSVSWISDYGEFEWVFRRAFQDFENTFELELIHDDGNIQIATVTRHEH